jgi:hypothetical protein
MTHKLAELRSGGRLSPGTIEVLPVKLDKESSGHVKIKDLAQVVSKGQYIHIILSDEEVCQVNSFLSVNETNNMGSISSQSAQRYKGPISLSLLKDLHLNLQQH